MTIPRVRTLAAVSAIATAAIFIGCGGDSGASTTTASNTTATMDTGIVTIQTDTVVTNTTPAGGTGTTGVAALDTAVATIGAVATETLQAIEGGVTPEQAQALVAQLTNLNERFDRAADDIRRAVVDGSAAAQRLKVNITTAATNLSDAYRTFVDALAQAADSNDATVLNTAVSQMQRAVGEFIATSTRG